MSSPRAVPSRQHQVPVEDTETHAQSEAKRRKVRKGTRSCWECKRRKMKCIFNPPTNATCNGCRRRGSKCVSQEFPENVSLSMEKTHKMGDGVVRVETMVDQFVMHTGSDGTTSDGRTPTTPSEEGERTEHAILTPASITSEPSRFLAFYKYSKVRIRASDIV